MKTLAIVYVLVVIVVVGGIQYVNHEINVGVKEHITEYVPQVDIQGHTEPLRASQDIFLASYPIDTQGVTEPWDIQPAMGYRLYQPTFNPAL